jgi:hypothetical protein
VKRALPIIALAVPLLALLPGAVRAQTRLATPSSAQFARKWDAKNFSHRLFDSLLRRHVKRGRVDIAGLRRHSLALLREYQFRLANTRPAQLKGGKTARLAFWINAYNALALRAALRQTPRGARAKRSLRRRGLRKLWSRLSFQVGGQWYTLAQIRDRIIRQRFADPRAHFALVRLARGTIWMHGRAYSARRLSRRLWVAARRYLSAPGRVRVDRVQRLVYLPPLFRRYEKDFSRPPGKGVLSFVATHLGNASDAAFIRANLARLTVSYQRRTAPARR